MFKIGHRELIFSFNTFSAAMLGLTVSFWSGLDRPYWAMATAFITSQPLSGAVRSKAVFRLVGTIVGAGVAVALVPNLANAPVLLTLALALWVSACQFVSLLDRTPRSYMFMLAGYTVALIGFPSVTQPDAIFNIAVLRSEEIAVGVLCAAFMHSVVFPRSVTSLLAERVTTIMADAESWIADALSPEHLALHALEQRRLTTNLSELHVLATHLPFDTARIRPERALLTALQDRMIMLLPILSSVEDRTRGLLEMGTLEPRLAGLLGAAGAWLQECDSAECEALVARAEAMATADTDRSWRALLMINLTERLAELLTGWRDARLLAEQVSAPECRVPPAVQALLGEVASRPLHRDYGLAFLSAAATFVAIIACCAFWIATAWPEGAGAAAFAAVICCFFAMLDDPVPAQRGFLAGTAVAMPLAGLYLFVILPRIDGMVMLTVALAPTLLVLGAIMGLPQWYGRIMPVMLGFAGGVAFSNDLTIDSASFFNNNIALLVGIGVAIITTQVFRSIGAATAIRRLQVAGWRDLAAMPVQGSRDMVAWTSRMLDRIGLLASRIGQTGDDEPDIFANALREMRIGVSVGQLGAEAPRLRFVIADHFEAQAEGVESAPSPMLLDRIDDAIAAGWQITDRMKQRRMLTTLTGLRRNFFPDATDWTQRELAS